MNNPISHITCTKNYVGFFVPENHPILSKRLKLVKARKEKGVLMFYLEESPDGSQCNVNGNTRMFRYSEQAAIKHITKFGKTIPADQTWVNGRIELIMPETLSPPSMHIQKRPPVKRAAESEPLLSAVNYTIEGAVDYLNIKREQIGSKLNFILEDDGRLTATIIYGQRNR